MSEHPILLEILHEIIHSCSEVVDKGVKQLVFFELLLAFRNFGSDDFLLLGRLVPCSFLGLSDLERKDFLGFFVSSFCDRRVGACKLKLLGGKKTHLSAYWTVFGKSSELR